MRLRVCVCVYGMYVRTCVYGMYVYGMYGIRAYAHHVCMYVPSKNIYSL